MKIPRSFWFFAWLARAVGAGAIASGNHRSFFGCFLPGLVSSLIGLLIAIGMAPKQPAPRAGG